MSDFNELPFSSISYCPYGSLKKQAPYVETPVGTVRRVAEFANITRDSILIDIGCGAGEFLNAMLDYVPEFKGIGLEIEQDLILKAKETAIALGVANRVDYRQFDFYKDEMEWISKKVTHVYLYLVPRQLHDSKFRIVLESIANAGIPIVSYNFAISYLTLAQKDETFQLFLYGLPIINDNANDLRTM